MNFCFLLLFLLPCVWTDLRAKELSLVYMLGFILVSWAVTLGLNLFAGFRIQKNVSEAEEIFFSLYDLAIGGVMGVFLMILCRCTKGAIGTGDGILIFAIGITIGCLKTIEVLILSCSLSSLAALIELCVFKRKKDFAIPFAPFLFCGVLGAMMF